MRFENEYDFLHNDYPTQVPILGNVYPCVTSAVLALRCRDKADRDAFQDKDANQARELAKLTRPRFDWEEAEIDALTLALIAKFKNRRLMGMLRHVPYVTIVYENDTDSHLGVVEGIGQNMLGQLLTMVRDGNVDESDITETFEDKPTITYIHPGQIRPMKEHPRRCIAKIPWPNINGTISVIIPIEEISNMEDVVKSGKYRGKHYKQAILTQKVYLTVVHDISGNVVNDNILVQPMLDPQQLVMTYIRNRANVIRQTRRVSKDDAKSIRTKTREALKTIMKEDNSGLKQISFCDYSKDVLDDVDWRKRDPALTIRIAPYDNIPASLKLTVVNQNTGLTNEVTLPPIFPISVPIPRWCCFIDIQGQTDVVAALVHMGVLIPMRTNNNQTFLRDARGEYIAHFFSVCPQVVMLLDPKGIQVYYKNYIEGASTIADSQWMQVREAPPEHMRLAELEAQSNNHDIIVFEKEGPKVDRIFDEVEAHRKQLIAKLKKND